MYLRTEKISGCYTASLKMEERTMSQGSTRPLKAENIREMDSPLYPPEGK